MIQVNEIEKDFYVWITIRNILNHFHPIMVQFGKICIFYRLVRYQGYPPICTIIVTARCNTSEWEMHNWVILFNHSIINWKYYKAKSTMNSYDQRLKVDILNDLASNPISEWMVSWIGFLSWKAIVMTLQVPHTIYKVDIKFGS